MEMPDREGGALIGNAGSYGQDLLRFSAITGRLREQGNEEAALRLEDYVAEVAGKCPEHGLLLDPAIGLLPHGAEIKIVIACPWCSGSSVLERWEAQAPEDNEG